MNNQPPHQQPEGFAEHYVHQEEEKKESETESLITLSDCSIDEADFAEADVDSWTHEPMDASIRRNQGGGRQPTKAFVRNFK